MNGTQAVTAFIRTQRNHPALKGSPLMQQESFDLSVRRQEQATSDIPARVALNARAKRHKPSVEEAAAAFIDKNPEVWALFRRFTLEAISAGRKRLGIALIFERMRWETMLTSDDPDGFKLNNNHKAFFARKFMAERPEYTSLFTTRKTEKEKSKCGE